MDLQRLLKDSWALVEDQQDRVAGYFYARMFLSSPALRELFPVHMDVQRSRLLGAIVNAIQAMDDPGQLDEFLGGLGRDHRKFRVEREHYDVVGRALVESLRVHAGQRWSHQYEQAWWDAYQVIARKMISAAAEDPNPPWWEAEVVAHERRARDIAVFTVAPLDPPVPYQPGQYVSIETRIQPRLWRTYSVANAPRSDHTLDFHVRTIGNGWVSSALVRRTAPGQLLRIAAPMGSMVLDPTSDRDIVCMAGGTGLAPIKALVDELRGYNRTRQVHLFFGARTHDDLYDLPAVNRLAERVPWLTVVPALSAETWEGECGTIPDVMQRWGPWDNHDFYVSGSGPMVQASLRTLAWMQVPSVRIRYDAFGDG